MSDFGEEYTGPDRRHQDAFFKWEWPDTEPVDETSSPDIERMVEDLEVPIEDGVSQASDETRKLQRRLELMGVEDPRSLSRRKVREVGSLVFAAYSLEDVHYDVYSQIRNKDKKSTYVSVTAQDILSAVPTDDRDIMKLQSDQTLEAYVYLRSLGLNRVELREWVDNGNQRQKFALRCLSRLMTERHLEVIAKDLSDSHDKRRGKSRHEGSVYYGQVVYDALGTINNLHQEHLDHTPLTDDGRLGYMLEDRALVRTLSFAKPLVGISRPE